MNDTPKLPTNVAIIHGQLSHGGSERQLYMFLQQCDRRRWQPHLYLSGELGVWESPIRALGVSITLLRGTAIQKMWQFRRLCQAQQVQYFFSWSSYTNGYALALAGLGIPCIGSIRNALFIDLPERYRWFWSWLSLAGLSTVVCNSQETLAALQKEVGQRKRLVYLPNGVQAMPDGALQRSAWRQRLAIGEEAILVVGVGRLTEQKNFARFIEAIVLVNRTDNHTQPVYAVIAGPDMGLKAQLQQQIAAANLAPEVIRLLGPVPDARTLICAADIFLLSSDYEGMPNVVLEAMVAGVPCVSTHVNGIDTLIQSGVHGFVTEHTPEALAEALLRIVCDPVLRGKLGSNAQAHIQGAYDPAQLYPRLWQLCE
jgi:glycosyltransferase involved in cell wall biosynthesis